MSEPETLDAQGLLCPLPVIRTQDRIRNLQPGTLLTVIASDPGTLHDIPAWCRVHGHQLLAAETDPPPPAIPDGSLERTARSPVYRFRIRVVAD